MQATASNRRDGKAGSRRHRGRRRLMGLHLGFCVLAGLLIVTPVRVAAAVPTDWEVEDVIIARSLRNSRNTGVNITAGCAASITGFTATIEDIFEMYSVKLSNQGIVKDDAWYKTGDLHVCLAPTAPVSTVLNFWTDGTLTGVSFNAIGTCTERSSDFPETGLRMFSCYQDLKNLSGGYIGGTLTTNTISSLQLIGEESNPPGYTQASIATVRLWKPRSAGACTGGTGLRDDICVGDCDASGAVIINELVTLISIGVGNAQPSACPSGVPSSAEVDIAWIIRAVNNALTGCSAEATPTPTATSAPPEPTATVDEAYTDPERVEARLRGTVEDLAALGNKRAGTEADAQAGDYVFERFRAAGLSDVHFEEFSFPRYDLHATRIEVTSGEQSRSMTGEAFAYSGIGRAEGAAVFAGTGRPQEYAGIDATGKVVLVRRVADYHRTAQYRQVIEHGGAAMLYVSQAPENLIQIGTTVFGEDGAGPIPSVSVGHDDGEALIAAVQAGVSTQVAIEVDADVQPARGRNVVGRLPGTMPGGEYLVVGAHYDTWYTGASDNGTGVATVVEIAQAFAARPARQLDLVFIGYDAEEIGLFGGYDWLRQHVVLAGEPMVGFIHFDVPAAGPAATGPRRLFHTSAETIVHALEDSGTSSLYPTYLGLEVVPAVTGGLIATDIQGIYRGGLHGFWANQVSPYYHTTEDTPEKIDLPFLTDAVLHFEKTLDALDVAPICPLLESDPAVWSVDGDLIPVSDGLRVELRVSDAAGTPQPAAVEVWVDVDDFTRVYRAQTTADAAGGASIVVPSAALAAGAGDRWLHATAGLTYPLAEWIQPLD